MKEKLQQYSSGCKLKLDEASFLLSFSGGMDSTMMASLLLEIRKQHNFKLGFAHINHHMHKKSNDVATFTSNYCLEKNVNYYQHDLYFNSKYNFEAYARKKRYSILYQIAENKSYNFILTAHHQDDQLETLYMKNIDGGDWTSQIGIYEKMGKIRRPFLSIPKSKIKVYIKKQNIPWVEDPTNYDLTFRRNKIRNDELPKAIKADSNLKYELLNSAYGNLLRMKKTLIKLKKDQVSIIISSYNNKVQLNRVGIGRYNIEELKLFIYIYVASILGIKINNQSAGLWREFKNYIIKSSTGAIFNIDNLLFTINRQNIVAEDKNIKLKTIMKMRLRHNIFWYSGKFIIKDNCTFELSNSKNKFSVPSSLYKNGIYVRAWEYGDKIISATSKKHVSVSDLYINNKLSKYEKEIQPVIVDSNDSILWIPGHLHGEINYNNKEKIKLINWTK